MAKRVLPEVFVIFPVIIFLSILSIFFSTFHAYAEENLPFVLISARQEINLEDYMNGKIILNLSEQQDVEDEDLEQLSQKPFSKIRDVYLRDTNISDEGMKYFTNQTLERLILTSTSFTGSGFDYLLAQRHPLTVLYLGNTQVDNEKIKKLRKILSLQDLDLTNTKIDDEAIEHLTKLRLKRLNVNSTGVGDEGIELMPLSSLVNLDVSNTSVSDEGIKSLFGTKIEYLRLKNTLVTDRSMKIISRLALKHLDLAQTRVTSLGVKRFGRIPLKRLSLIETEVDGEALSELNYTLLSSLNISRTKIEGKDLNLLKEGKRLEYLGLAGLAIEDEDLKILENLNIKTLVLSDNKISSKGLLLLEKFSLKKLYICGNSISELDLANFIERNPETKVFTKEEIREIRGREVKFCVSNTASFNPASIFLEQFLL